MNAVLWVLLIQFALFGVVGTYLLRFSYKYWRTQQIEPALLIRAGIGFALLLLVTLVGSYWLN